MDYTTVAQTFAVPSAFMLGTYNFVFSQNVVPYLYTVSPSISTPIFAKIYYTGAKTIVPIAAPTILAYGYLSYTSTSTKRTLYAASAALTLSTLLLTRAVMLPGIERLIAISKDSQLLSAAGTSQEVTRLLKSWVSNNYLRASLNVAAGVVALYAGLI